MTFTIFYFQVLKFTILYNKYLRQESNPIATVNIQTA